MNPRNPFPADLDPTRLPQHVAVIMDGNGRWATRQGLPRIAGHREGAKTLKRLLRCCKDWGISALTSYAFSTENWRRPLTEVDFLMALFERLLRRELAEMHQEGVRIRFLGDLSVLPVSLKAEMDRAMETTAANQAITFNVAINYGSRQELVHACQTIAQQVQQGTLAPEDISEEMITRSLDTQGDPDPDLLIRTSGEMRISNYLLWQLAYAEFYFTETLWPDFDPEAFHQALLAYQDRDRRFGGLTKPALSA